LFGYHTLTLLGVGSGISFVVNMWMRHLGRTVENGLTHQFDLVVGMLLAVVGLSVLAAVRYWNRPPFLWACCAATALAVGNTSFALFYGVLGAVSVFISSKLRDASAYWFGTGLSEKCPAKKDDS
jgi:hypothetical protein